LEKILRTVRSAEQTASALLAVFAPCRPILPEIGRTLYLTSAEVVGG
jgi:hypothetical protein